VRIFEREILLITERPSLVTFFADWDTDGRMSGCGDPGDTPCYLRRERDEEVGEFWWLVEMRVRS